MREAYRVCCPTPSSTARRWDSGCRCQRGSEPISGRGSSTGSASPAGPLAPIVDPVGAAAVVDRFLRGDDTFTYRAWNLLALATWAERRTP